MNREEVEIRALKILEIVLKCSPRKITSRENTPAWDSLKHIEVIFAIEDEFAVRFTEEDLSKANSLESIVDVLLK